MPARVAWVGVGVMGRHMVRHLMKAGHEATLFSRTPSKCAALVDAGAKLATSPKQAAQGADIVFTMVGAPADVETVTLGPDGEVDEEALLALTTARMLNPLLLSAEVVPVQAVAYDAINA